MSAKQSVGKCLLCGCTATKTAMTQHLAKCDKWPAGNHDTLLIRAEQKRSPYWLHLEVARDAALVVLDDVLREVWLECCGHMSRFTIAGKIYVAAQYGGDELCGAAIDQTRIGQVVKPGMSFEYVYDFGTPTRLTLTVFGARQSKLDAKQRARLLARNDPPTFVCVECGSKQADAICSGGSCDGGSTVCETCSAYHACGEEMLLPLVNSPRTGVCGYSGPAD